MDGGTGVDYTRGVAFEKKVLDILADVKATPATVVLPASIPEWKESKDLLNNADDDEDEDIDESIVKAVAPVLVKASTTVAEADADSEHATAAGVAYRSALRRLNVGLPVRESEALTAAKRAIKRVAAVEEAARLDEAKKCSPKPKVKRSAGAEGNGLPAQDGSVDEAADPLWTAIVKRTPKDYINKGKKYWMAPLDLLKEIQGDEFTGGSSLLAFGSLDKAARAACEKYYLKNSESIDEGALDSAALLNLKKALALIDKGDKEAASEFVKKAITNLTAGGKPGGVSSASRPAVSAAVKECVERGILDESLLVEYMQVASSYDVPSLTAAGVPVSAYNGNINLSYDGFFAKVPHYGVADFLIQGVIRQAIQDGDLDDFVDSVKKRLADSPKVAALEVALVEGEVVVGRLVESLDEAKGGKAAKAPQATGHSGKGAPKDDKAGSSKIKAHPKAAAAAKAATPKIANLKRQGNLKVNEGVFTFPAADAFDIAEAVADLGIPRSAGLKIVEGNIHLDLNAHPDALAAVAAFIEAVPT
jgi:hypothetical protein